jgi:hypothetical protein
LLLSERESQAGVHRGECGIRDRNVEYHYELAGERHPRDGSGTDAVTDD